MKTEETDAHSLGFAMPFVRLVSAKAKVYFKTSKKGLAFQLKVLIILGIFKGLRQHSYTAVARYVIAVINYCTLNALLKITRQKSLFFVMCNIQTNKKERSSNGTS